MTNKLNIILTTNIKPEDTLINSEGTFGKYNVSIDKIFELKAKNPKMGYRKIGKELGVNYKVIQRAYNKHKQEYAKSSQFTEANIPKYKPNLYKIYDNIFWQLGVFMVGCGKDVKNEELKSIFPILNAPYNEKPEMPTLNEH